MEQVIHSTLHKNGAASRLRPEFLVFKKDHSLQIRKRHKTYNTLAMRLLVWQKGADYKSLWQFVCSNPFNSVNAWIWFLLSLNFLFASVSPSWGGFGNIPGTDIYKKVKDYKNVSNFWVVSLQSTSQCKTKLCLVNCGQFEFGSGVLKDNNFQH